MKKEREYEFRRCFNRQCTKPLFYNESIPIEIWRSSNIQIFCCNCFKHLKYNFPNGEMINLKDFLVKENNVYDLSKLEGF